MSVYRRVPRVQILLVVSGESLNGHGGAGQSNSKIRNEEYSIYQVARLFMPCDFFMYGHYELVHLGSLRR